MSRACACRRGCRCEPGTTRPARGCAREEVAGVDELVIDGGVSLRGALTPSGNKNAAFPLIAAALLTDQPVTLRNVPDISDVRTLLAAMEGLGVEVTRHDRHAVTLTARALRSTSPDPALV